MSQQDEDRVGRLLPHAKLAAVLACFAAVFAMGYSTGFRAGGDRLRELDARLAAYNNALSATVMRLSSGAPAGSATSKPDVACNGDDDADDDE